MDEEFIQVTRRRMEFLDDVVDVRNGRTDKKGKNECNYILAGSPKSHVDGIENSQKCETPMDSINNDLLSFRGELIDDGTQKEEVDQ